MVQLWHCSAGDLNFMLMRHTLCLLGGYPLGSEGVLVLLLLFVFVISLFTTFYQILFDFLDNFILFFSVF